MRFIAPAFAGGLLLVATAAYADDPMANTYANTVVTKDAKGMSGSLLFNKDGSYTANATGPDGKPVSIPGNKWVLKDGGKTICLTPVAQPNGPPPQTSCSPLAPHNVGDSWSVTNDQGQTFNVSLTAGRYDGFPRTESRGHGSRLSCFSAIATGLSVRRPDCHKSFVFL